MKTNKKIKLVNTQQKHKLTSTNSEGVGVLANSAVNTGLMFGCVDHASESRRIDVEEELSSIERILRLLARLSVRVGLACRNVHKMDDPNLEGVDGCEEGRDEELEERSVDECNVSYGDKDDSNDCDRIIVVVCGGRNTC